MTNRPSFIVFLVIVTCACIVSAAQPPEQPVTFSFSARQASSVALAGTFNHWNPLRHPLTGPDRNGMWSITLPLAPGRHEYLFVLDGSRWETDPAALTADDGMGGRNSVILIEPK